MDDQRERFRQVIGVTMSFISANELQVQRSEVKNSRLNRLVAKRRHLAMVGLGGTSKSFPAHHSQLIMDRHRRASQISKSRRKRKRRPQKIKDLAASTPQTIQRTHLKSFSP